MKNLAKTIASLLLLCMVLLAASSCEKHDVLCNTTWETEGGFIKIEFQRQSTFIWYEEGGYARGSYAIDGGNVSLTADSYLYTISGTFSGNSMTLYYSGSPLLFTKTK